MNSRPSRNVRCCFAGKECSDVLCASLIAPYCEPSKTFCWAVSVSQTMIFIAFWARRLEGPSPNSTIAITSYSWEWIVQFLDGDAWVGTICVFVPPKQYMGKKLAGRNNMDPHICWIFALQRYSMMNGYALNEDHAWLYSVVTYSQCYNMTSSILDSAAIDYVLY